MAVPTPIALWDLQETTQTSPIVDEINGYLGTAAFPSSGLFGVADSPPPGGTSFFCDASNYNRFILSDTFDAQMSPNTGSASVWAKISNITAGFWILAIRLNSFGPQPTNYLHMSMLLNHTNSDRIEIQARSYNTAAGNDWTDTNFWASTAYQDGWVQFGMTWGPHTFAPPNSLGFDHRVRLYINGTPVVDSGFEAPPGPIVPADTYNNITETQGNADVWWAYHRFWDVELTEAQMLEQYETDISGAGELCERTIPLKEIKRIWTEVEKFMSCRAAVQRESIFGWTTFAENVPCTLQLSGTTQELNSADEYVSIQSWTIQISGRTRLPNPGAFDTVRFLVNGMTLESYEFYQSIDDFTTTIECRRI